GATARRPSGAGTVAVAVGARRGAAGRAPVARAGAGVAETEVAGRGASAGVASAGRDTPDVLGVDRRAEGGVGAAGPERRWRASWWRARRVVQASSWERVPETQASSGPSLWD